MEFIENNKKKIYPKIIRGAGCFVSKTKVYTPNGYINIDKIKVGDKVYCFDENLQIQISEVEKTFFHPKKEVIDIYFDNKKIRTTPNHPFLNQNNKFIEIGNFTFEDNLINRFNKKIKIKKIKIIKKLYDVYNFTVKKYHTYIVEDIFVHNKGGPPPCYPNPPPDPHTPVEATEGIDKDSRVVSRTETEVTDLICEGPIDGLVSGTYTNVGRVGAVGWDSASFTPYRVFGPPEDRILRSVFWRNVPIVDDQGQYNYASVKFRYDYGNQTSPTTLSNLEGSTIPNATRTLSIGDVLKYGWDFNKSYDFRSIDVSKFIVAIKIDSLFDQQNNPNLDKKTYNLNCGQSVKISQTLGDIRDRTIDYRIQIIKLTTNGSITVIDRSCKSKGKVSSGFIDTFEFDLSSHFTPDETTHLGWRIRITRNSPDSTVLNLRDSCSVHAITEVFTEQYIYPKVAIFKNLFTTDYFQDVPNRAYDVKLLKVKIPSNYDPIKKTYRGDWDGRFSDESHIWGTGLYWTDNPAWCYYDILTNKRYGLGKYIENSNVDKWNLYKISKYCDTIVSDGYGGLEPRFTCNAIITDFSDAFNLLNDFASIFRGMSYYANGSIYAIADIPQNPYVLFTNANVENGDFNYSSSSKKVRNTIAVIRYNDMNNFAKPVVEYVEDPDAVRKYGIRKLEITAFGCTSKGQAYRLGRWALASEQLETETVDFVAGLDALYLKPGDLIKIQDSNRMLNRLGGRVLEIQNNGTHSFVLDGEYDKIKSYIQNQSANNFVFEIFTPTYKVTGTNYSDFTSSYERSEIQSGICSLTSLQEQTGINPEKKLTKINTNKIFNTTDYVLQTGAIWTINLGINTTQINKETETYRVIGLTELEGNKYNINAIEYNSSKYLFVESGISFEDAPPVNNPVDFQLEAGGPYDILLTKEADIYLNYAITHSIVPNTETKYWRVYVKPDYDFGLADLSRQLVNLKGETVLVPRDNYLVDTVPLPDQNQDVSSKFVPTKNNTTYYVRVYGTNSQGYYSKTYATRSFFYSSELLKDLTNILYFDKFQYSINNSITNNVIYNAPNLFKGESNFNFNWSIQNIAPEIKQYSSNDLTYNLTFGTGIFNSNVAQQNTIREFNININERDNLLASTGISTEDMQLILKDYTMSGFWLAIDAKDRTGQKYISQQSSSSLRYTRNSGYLAGYFYNDPIYPRVLAANLENANFGLSSSNNIYLSANFPSDTSSVYIFFTDRSTQTGLLTESNLNSILSKATKTSNYDVIEDLYSKGIQLREARGDNAGTYTTTRSLINTNTLNSLIKTGWAVFRPVSDFDAMLIDRYNKQFGETGFYKTGLGSAYNTVNYGSLPVGISQVYKWNNSSDERNVFNNIIFARQMPEVYSVSNDLNGSVTQDDLSGFLKRTVRTNSGSWYIDGTSTNYSNFNLNYVTSAYTNSSASFYNSSIGLGQNPNVPSAALATVYLEKCAIYDFYGSTNFNFYKGFNNFQFAYNNHASGGFYDYYTTPKISITSGALEMTSGLIGIDDISMYFYKRSGSYYHNYPAGTPAGNPNGKTYARIFASYASGLYVSGNLTITGGTGASMIAPSGYLHMTGNLGISGTTANSATAGTANLPTNPKGFLNVNINNSGFKVPYYNI